MQHYETLVRASAGAAAAAATGNSNLTMGALACIVAVAVGLVCARISTNVLRRFFGNMNLPVSSASIVVNIVRGLIALVVAYIISENVFDVQLSGIVQALGVTALVVSLGLQDLIKNMVAGIQILLTRIFTVGDQLDVGSVRGEVMDINWRQTVLRDKDGDTHVIPNSTLMGGVFMRREGKLVHRYEIHCDIKPGLDLNRVAEDIEALANATLSEHGWKSEEDTEVRFVESTANGIGASVRIFLADIEYTTRSKDAVMRAIAQRGYLADWTNDCPAQEQWR